MNYVWQHQWSQHIDQRLYIETRVSFFKVCRGIPSCNWHVTRFSPCIAFSFFSLSLSFFPLWYIFLFFLSFLSFPSIFLFIFNTKEKFDMESSFELNFQSETKKLEKRYTALHKQYSLSVNFIKNLIIIPVRNAQSNQQSMINQLHSNLLFPENKYLFTDINSTIFFRISRFLLSEHIPSCLILILFVKKKKKKNEERKKNESVTFTTNYLSSRMYVRNPWSRIKNERRV